MIPVEWVDPQEWAAIDLAFRAVEHCKSASDDAATCSDEFPVAKKIRRQLPSWFSVPAAQYQERKKFQPLCFKGKIVYCGTFAQVESAACELRDAVNNLRSELATGEKIPMGFDIEWRPTFRRGVTPGKAAVLQLCLDSKQCYVLHILHSGFPKALLELLLDVSVCKVGVAIQGDVDKLHLDHEVSVTEVVDLAAMANSKLAEFKKWSLSSLAEELTCKAISKPSDIRCGNWEVQPLSKAQLEYAATDAFASLYIYQVLATFPDPSPEGEGQSGAIQD